jgi:hypothetical protein
MTNVSKKGVLLFIAAVAVSVFAPSITSAASWSPIGSHHTLDSNNAGFRIDLSGVHTTCGQSAFTATVVSSSDLRITSASYTRCTASGAAVGTCTATLAGTNFPWRATPISTTVAAIDGVRVDVLLENHPGSAACSAAGANIIVTGNLNVGSWNNLAKELAFVGASGLVTHSALGNGVPVTWSGVYRDTQNLQILF